MTVSRKMEKGERQNAPADKGEVSGDTLRRRPRQVRSQERISRILDTAEQVFADVGYGAATTNLIASQAQTSIGSLYEFFPNKEAIGRALADRYVEQIDNLYANLFSASATDIEIQAPELVDRIVGGLDRFYRDHPGAIPLLNGQLTSPELAAAGARVQIALERRVEALIVLRRGDLPVAKCHQIALVVCDVTRALLLRADQVPLSQRASLIREIEHVVVGYLRHLGEIFDAGAETASTPTMPPTRR
jgi:AcrR family transcriptional regulator